MKIFRIVLLMIVVALIAATSFIHFGVFEVAADKPHSRPVYWLAETVRERSIAMRARNLEVPNLEDSEMLLAGGPDYNEMCAGCHLKPGQTQSEISLGLYPQPPNLSQASAQSDLETAAKRRFWIIKHGLKMTGMPAWGATHDDTRIWAMVAFIQKLPTLDAAKYQILTARAEGELGHEHGPQEPESAAGTGEHEAHSAHPGMAGPETAAPADTALAALDAFHKALQAADQNVATQMLAPDVLIYEGGGVQRSRNEYASHHMKSDMAFLGTAKVELIKRDVQERDETAVISSESRIRGKNKKGDVDVISTETAVLKKAADGWRITHLHWSSRDYQPAAAHQH